jgi:hypothetical protein
MGLGDFLSGAAESVGHWAGGVAQGVGTVVTHLDDVARGAAWAVNPTHYDDIARGAGNVAEYIGEHPGQIWDTGFEVGRYMVKDQLLDPKNLLLNAGMIGLSAATAGGASGLLAARVANWGREGVAALRGVRGLEEVASGARAIEGGLGAAEAAEAGASAARATGRIERFMGKADDILGGNGIGAKAREAVTGKEFGLVNRGRNALAANVAERGGIAGQVAAQSIGVGNARPIIEGSRVGQGISDVMWLNRQKGRIESTAGTVSKFGEQGRDLTQAVTDPLGFGLRKAKEHGHDPESAINSAVGQAQTKIAQKALGGGKKKARRQSSYDDMAGGSGGYMAASAADGGAVGAPLGTKQARVTGEGSENVSSDFSVSGVGRRRSSFYAGTNETYADQARSDDSVGY